MAEREVRDYELSLWTLQDSFITVLKPFGQEIKGQVQEGKLHISDDGTESLSFSIPMYLYQRDGNNGAVKVENPLWHNVINGILIANMRKIKLIFDKHGTREKVFEFIILKTTERHESDQLFCDVECEGLAFHELGKIGYKLELNADEFELDHKNWEESDKTEDEPVATLQYWNNKIFSNRRDWGYEVRMDYREEIGREGLSSEKVYEDRYVASWTVVDNQIQPTRWELGKEKARTTFDIKESNIYNITQEIAEAFGVFCKYEYEHDYNYHITKRTVIYYNNFLNEEAGVIDLTYPYNTNNITREMDSTDLITKMYVQSVDDELTDEGTVSITGVEANKMKEDYLLNFDYLYNIGTISQEQYDGIKEFEVEIRKLNEKFEKYSEIYSHRANQINSLEADIQNLKDAIVADNEELNTVNEQIRALGLSDGDGNASSVSIKMPNPNAQRTPFTSTKKNGKMAISLIAEHSKGIKNPETNIKIYSGYNPDTGEVKNKVTGWKIYADSKTKEIYEIYGLPSKDKNNTVITTFYVSYTCTPSLQYKEIKDNFTKKLSQDTRRLNQLTKRYENIKKIYENAEKQIESLRTKKAELILEFEHLMGSALREGYWNPENYNDYGNKYTGNIKLNRTTSNKHTTLDLGIRAQDILVSDTSDRYLEFMWGNGKDSTGDELDIWADEQKSYYEEGVNLDKVYYPCIRISGPVLKKMIQNKENINLFSLLFYIGDETENQRILEDIDGWIGFNIGSQCQIGFRKGYLKGDKTEPYIFPVFVMTGLDDYSEDTAMAVMSTSAYFAQTQEIIDGEIQMEDIEAAAKRTSADDKLLWWHDNDNVNGASRLTKKVGTDYVSLGEDYYPVPAYDLYYPRIIIKSQKLKKSSDGTEPDLTIKCGNSISGASSLQKLTDYEDYSIINSISEVEDTDEDALPYMYEAITIKPFSLLCYGSTTRNQNGTDIYCPMPILQIDYTISNADTAIYLDAIQVLKENSQPKASYTIDLNNLGKELINTAYNLLGIVAHINDTDLKFNNIQGYVSEVEMNLDKPWEDSITIQNYKNKFEDLFSKIVAETAQMQKNSYTVGFAAQALTAGGGITEDVMQYTLANNTNLTYAFNNGRLTIDEVNGIIGESRDGIVAYRGGGIFTASEKDDEGNWIWNTGILPTGINASLITTGRLDTNQVNVYAGNDLRFVWNGEGLTAYKWNTNAMDLAIANGTSVPDDYAPAIDSKQYVRFNGEGLKLIAESGSQHISRTWDDDYIEFEFETNEFTLTLQSNKILDSNNNVVGSYSLNSGETLSKYDVINLEDTGIITGFIFGDDEAADGIDIGSYTFSYQVTYNYTGKLQNGDNIIGQYEYDNIKQQYIITTVDGNRGIYKNIPIPNEIFSLKLTLPNFEINKIILEDYIYECNFSYYWLSNANDDVNIITNIELRLRIKCYPKNLDKIYTYDGENSITRVEVSWRGFLLRNWNNEEVFWADPETGNLYARFDRVGMNLDNPGGGVPDDNDSQERYIFFDTASYSGKLKPRLISNNAEIEFNYHDTDFKGTMQYTGQFLYRYYSLYEPKIDTHITFDDHIYMSSGQITLSSDGFFWISSEETLSLASKNIVLDADSSMSIVGKNVLISSNAGTIVTTYTSSTSQSMAINSNSTLYLRGGTTLSGGASTVITSTKSIQLRTTDNTTTGAYINANANTYVNITAHASNVTSTAGAIGIHADSNGILHANAGYIYIRTGIPDMTTPVAGHIFIGTGGSISLDAHTYIYFHQQSRNNLTRWVFASTKPNTTSGTHADYDVIWVPTNGGNIQFIPCATYG